MSVDKVIAYALTAGSSSGQTGKSGGDVLTAREREVVSLIALGATDREIAGKLVISEHTAHSHVRHVLSKLRMQSRAQIAAWEMSRASTTSETTRKDP